MAREQKELQLSQMYWFWAKTWCGSRWESSESHNPSTVDLVFDQKVGFSKIIMMLFY